MIEVWGCGEWRWCSLQLDILSMSRLRRQKDGTETQSRGNFGPKRVKTGVRILAIARPFSSLTFRGGSGAPPKATHFSPVPANVSAGGCESGLHRRSDQLSVSCPTFRGDPRFPLVNRQQFSRRPGRKRRVTRTDIARIKLARRENACWPFVQHGKRRVRPSGSVKDIVALVGQGL